MRTLKRWTALLVLSLTYKRHLLFRSCVVFGEEDFCRLIVSTKAKLDRELPEISEMLLTQNWIIWKPIGDKAALSLQMPLMGISKGWVDWNEEGVAAFIIYAVLLKQITQSRRKNLLIESRRIAKNETLTILQELGYPLQVRQRFEMYP